MKWYNVIGRIKLFIASRISKAIKRELSIIFRNCGNVSIDHHLKQDSWAIIKVDTGPKTCYLKFIDLNRQELRDICQFLSRYDNSKIDTNPMIGNQINRMYKMFDFL